MRIIVHPRVCGKRPWLTDEEVAAAWENAARIRPRQGDYEPRQMMAVAWDGHGRLLEILACHGRTDDEWLIFHAAPAQRKFLREMGFTDKQIHELIGRR